MPINTGRYHQYRLMNDCPSPFNVFRDDYWLAGITRDCANGGESNGIFSRSTVYGSLAQRPTVPMFPEKDFGVSFVALSVLTIVEWNDVLGESTAQISF